MDFPPPNVCAQQHHPLGKEGAGTGDPCVATAGSHDILEGGEAAAVLF